MGFGGSKIVGHSGTSFKHRKAFTKIKKFNKLTELSYENAPELNDQEQVRKPMISRNLSKKGRVREYVVLAVIIIISLFLFLHFIDILNSKSTNYLGASLERHTEHRARLDLENYNHFIDVGYDNLRRNNLDNAQLYFVKALEIDTKGKEAREGVTQVLHQQCELKKKFCVEYEENLAYLVAMKYDTEFLDQ